MYIFFFLTTYIFSLYSPTYNLLGCFWPTVYVLLLTHLFFFFISCFQIRERKKTSYHLYKIFRHRIFNRPKKGRCLLKKTHAHTIDIHVKKKKNNRIRWQNITNNTQKKKKKKEMMTTKQVHIRERCDQIYIINWWFRFLYSRSLLMYNEYLFKILDLPKTCIRI